MEYNLSEYVIRAALNNEENDGWVWISSGQSFAPRSILKIHNPNAHRHIYIQGRDLDQNFLRRYNADNARICVSEPQNTMVMSWWYRNGLGIAQTTSSNNETGKVSLSFSEAKVPVWRELRAACQHPDPVVVLGARLGVLGAFLGLLGIWLGVLGTYPELKSGVWLVWAGWSVIAIILLAAIVVSRSSTKSTLSEWLELLCTTSTE